MKKIAFVFLGTFISFVACNQSSKNNNIEKTIESEANETHELVSGNDVTACQHSSKIFWKGSKPGGEHNGFIKLKEGNYIVEDDKLLGGEFIIDMNSIVNIDQEDEEMNAKLVGHLKSADFFHVDSFPEAKYVITNIEELSGDEYTHSVTGDLTMKSITHSVSFKANIKVGDGKVSVSSEEFMINRTQWNVNYGSKSIFKELKDKFINDEFSLQIEAHSM